jgi:hypothetical protein
VPRPPRAGRRARWRRVGCPGCAGGVRGRAGGLVGGSRCVDGRDAGCPGWGGSEMAFLGVEGLGGPAGRPGAGPGVARRIADWRLGFGRGPRGRDAAAGRSTGCRGCVGGRGRLRRCFLGRMAVVQRRRGGWRGEVSLADGIDRVGADGQAEAGMAWVFGGWRFCLMGRRQETMRRGVRRLGDDRPVARFDIFTRRAAENREGPRRTDHLGTTCRL